MRVLYADVFVKNFKRLPEAIQDTYHKQEKIFKINWRDPRLHTKKLHGEPVTFSFRITRAYRALFVFVKPDTVLLAAIGHRKDVYR